VERSAWDASPPGARAAIQRWKDVMHANGYVRAYAYVPQSAGFDWIARWTGVAPTFLPSTCIGQQFASDHILGKPFDLSVFDARLLGDDDMALTPADVDLIWANRIDSPDGKQQHTAAYWLEHPNEMLLSVQNHITSIETAIGQLQDAVAALGSGAGGALTRTDVLNIINATSLHSG